LEPPTNESRHADVRLLTAQHASIDAILDLDRACLDDGPAMKSSDWFEVRLKRSQSVFSNR
jgi:hypothetical protein